MLDIKYRFTCGESDLSKIIRKCQNIMARIAVFFSYLLTYSIDSGSFLNGFSFDFCTTEQFSSIEPEPGAWVFSLSVELDNCAKALNLQLVFQTWLWALSLCLEHKPWTWALSMGLELELCTSALRLDLELEVVLELWTWALWFNCELEPEPFDSVSALGPSLELELFI